VFEALEYPFDVSKILRKKKIIKRHFNEGSKIFEIDVKKGTVNLNFNSSDIDEWDSVATVNIIVALEDEFGIKFKLEDIQTVKSVQDFVDLVQEHKK